MKWKRVWPKLLLLLVGLTPFLFGGLLNWASNAVDSALPWGWISLLTFLVWGGLAFFLGRLVKPTVQAVILQNLPALIVLLLLGYQLLVREVYWSNWLGLGTQNFFLPLLRWGFMLTPWFHTMFPVYCVEFVLMVAASILGCILYRCGRKGDGTNIPSGDPHSENGSGTILDEYLYR